MFSPNSTKACTKVKKMTRKREQNRALKKMKAYLIITITFENLQKMRSKMPSTSPKKEKQKTAVECELNSSKNCNDDTKEKSETSSMESYEKKTSRRKVGARSEFKSSTKKVTEKMQAITGHFAACQCYINCLPQYYIDHKIQPPDQGGLRPNHRTEDHLMVYRVLEQRCREWGVPLYISTIDFTKAFDRIKHSALWTSLQYYGIEPAYIRLLQRVTCFRSKGYEAGGPFVLFTLQHSVAIFFGGRSEARAGQQKGIRLSDKKEDCLTNLRFAYDVLLFPLRWENYVACKLCEFKVSIEAVGLGIHPDKTKILSNQDKEKAKEMVDNIKIEYWRKETVLDILVKESRSRSKKLKRSKTD